MAKKEDGRDFWGTLPFALLGGAVGWGAYMLIKNALTPTVVLPGRTQAAPVAPITAPPLYANLPPVLARFDQVKELYRMGYLSPEQALSEMATLRNAAQGFRAGSQEIGAMDAFVASVQDYLEMRRQGIVDSAPQAG